MGRRLISASLGVLLLVAIPSAPRAATGPAIPGTGCGLFPPDNAWHLRVDSLPIHPRNDVWRRSSHARSTLLHPDFGAAPYGMPWVVVGASTPTTPITFLYESESDPGPYPLTGSTALEGGSDHHALMVDADTCTLFETWATDWNDGSPTAGSGAIFDLGSNVLRPDTWTSADAAGLPVFAGLVRRDEVLEGEIDHAIRFTVACSSARHLWPARHDAATGGRRCPPMGARFRLKGGFDIGGFSPEAQVILTAMKRYGLILADNGSDWYFQGTMDSGWTDGLLDELKSVPARKFVAVDASGCRVDADSGRFAYGPGCPAPN